MSSVFSSPKTPKLPPAAEKVETSEQVRQEDTAMTRRNQRRRFMGQGRSGNILSGINSTLKTRLGQ